MHRNDLDLEKFVNTALCPDNVEKNTEFMKHDKFFKTDELI